MLNILFIAGQSLFRGFLFLLLCIGLAVAVIIGRELWKASRGNIIYEAECMKCHERFCPPNRLQVTHEYTEDDYPCGGHGQIFARYTV